MYKPIILLINATQVSDGRKVCEHLENQKFDSYDELKRAILEEDADVRTIDWEWYELTDFMDICNNEELNLKNWWVGYVYLYVDVKY